ncbi:sensor domain-containing diguanylate cyclase [Desulfonatronovibrio hydrogenovorans]|uniref:sensor domain-containing diguanylate cyclase n=1 Tax=Desulfonatronovibrio hydrogenovorans TaxID=53245 RepID=UPI001376778A|nr:sensor domain-containing diguanylate cyclase [Desulfonatronovibrio hydrogenovorans]
MSNNKYGLSIIARVRLLLVCLIIIPSLVGLIILETGPGDLQPYLAVVLVAGIILLSPLSSVISRYLVLKDLQDIERFCLQLKSGDYSARLSLPSQKEGEHEIMVLKRNLNWMAHVISKRERKLHQELQEINQDRSRYRDMSMLDPLTGLFNRRGLEARLEQVGRQALPRGQTLTLMFLDADKFKSVNDEFGHQAGDELLKVLAEIMRNNVREETDVPFRFGGDEFGILFWGIGSGKAAEIGQRILTAYNESRVGQTTLSIGIAGLSGAGQRLEPDLHGMLRAADQAAYMAKQMGGNRVFIHDSQVEQ